VSQEQAPGATSGTAARRARQEAQRGATRSGGGGGGRPGREHRSGPGPGDARTTDAPEGTAGGKVDPEPAETDRRALDPDALAVLEEERDFLLASLRDLEREHDAGDVDDHDYETLKDDYTARAATTLRAIETRQAALAAHRRQRRPGRALAIAAAVLVGAIGLGVFVARSSGERTAGGTVSGDIRQSTRDELLAAQNLMGEGKLSDALAAYQQIIAEDPANAQALAYKGWLLFLTSKQATSANDRDLLAKSALDSLDLAVKADPTYPDGHIFRAIVLSALGQDDAAVAEIDQVPASAVPADMTSLVDQFRQQVHASGTTPAAGSPAGTTPGH
jgi:tetratricopeptide (TPR) repeat protein